MFSRSIQSLALVLCVGKFFFFTSISAFTISTPKTSTTTTATTSHVIPRRRDDSHYPHQIVETIATTTVTALGSSTFSSSALDQIDNPTELPDSLTDGAERAATSVYDFAQSQGFMGEVRCRVDFDTTAGDETYPLIKTSTEFMQNFVSYLSYKYVPGLMQEKQNQVMRVAEARVYLQRILEQEQTPGADPVDVEEKRRLMDVLRSNGRVENGEASGGEYDGPIVRIYFPDEGNAALAQRDWSAGNGIDMPSCVRFNACGSRSFTLDTSKDCLVFFFCPKASESASVEEILQKTELTHSQTNTTQQLMTIFVNPQLVDMGVTGFGMAGRMLRERLLDGLTGAYYLRTLQWGALTRSWPSAYSLWEETADAEGGYKLLRTLPYLPTNPEVEDIYDEINSGKIQIDENGNQINKKGPSVLDQFADFVNGMMSL
mmetsp:Transcript_2782/g.3143  ORF Transcript_2782/g.3143 Transcript_2782/m.3143 type:complete len:431 (+) Transcript_2782:145-1437(+)